MSRKSKRNRIEPSSNVGQTSVCQPEAARNLTVKSKRNKILLTASSAVLALCLTVGVLGQFNLLPNGVGTFLGFAPAPVSAPVPSGTPQLAREFIYAGSRLWSVEDAGAQQVTPTDLAVWRISSGTWYVMGPGGSVQAAQQWGLSSDKPAPGDYDGDGKTDFCVFRGDPVSGSGTFYSLNSSDNNLTSRVFGANGDVPAPADYDGDGRTDFAVYRGSNATFFLIRSSDNQAVGLTVGSAGDLPVASDYDGDGLADPAVWHNATATFYWLKSGSNYAGASQAHGQSGDTPAPGDYDGDGASELTVFRSGVWYSRKISTGVVTTNYFGQANDTLVPGDYDADGKTDIAVWRAGTWFILKSSNNQVRTEQFGQTGDIPVPAPYKR